MRVQHIASSYRRLLDTVERQAAQLAGGHTPRVVLLTPGPYSETYFEHAYLARYLGLPLVEGGDLAVRGQRLFLMTPITGAMALASHSIVGEKQARTLEPLLATPITTVELLVAKVLGALWPSLGISLAALAIFFAGLAACALPGVAMAMLSMRTLLLVALVSPAAALVGLQAALIVSSRVNDARTAQQVGVLLIVPVTALLIAQFTGAVWLSNRQILAVGAVLLLAWLGLLALSAWLFRRETILTRWR